MKFLLGNNKQILLALVLFLLVLPGTIAQDIPPKPANEQTVYDFGNMLSAREASYFEQEMTQFARETSTQIVLVTVESLNGYDKADYAQRLAEKWGIGQKGKDNGILILLQPKTASQRGEAYIAVGYGLEGVVPDAIAFDIVNNEMIPSFKQGQTAQGINNAITVLMDITRGEYSAEEYARKNKGKGTGAGGIIAILIFFFFIRMFFGRSRRHHTMGGSSALPWFLMGTMMGGGSRSGSFGNFSGGSGGFGGFGGGGFGGGGAGGSW